ncbi:hypothetical protein CVV68_01335 [Arthrobacter livingstonensis]|uniref:Major facilitator superfamily (MFS) profile domain-containing protein n=1 Tax=Arthrobacter livingstonensis TaxID=670078 RepID=A0A2V5LDS9_9MICC|nr:MFS transporter [Arthrobacter livingstonensis]PYI69779.1 hypothetical protein CVV68_01335 [Arthrobacter livingstonensis]
MFRNPMTVAVEGLQELRRNGKVSTAVFVDTVGVGLMAPISLVYFTLTTNVTLAQLGITLTLATLASLPVGLLGGVIVDRFGVKAAMVSNNIVSAMGFLMYIFAQEPIGIFIALFLVASSERVYWASWSSYIHQMSAGRPFEKWFAFIEAVKAGAMGLGAILGAVLLSTAGTLPAHLVVLLNVATSLFAAVIFAIQPLEKTRTTPAATEEPELLSALKGFHDVITDPRSLLLAAGAFLLSPIMMLPNIAISVVLVSVWKMPPSVASILFALNVIVVALFQTTITHNVQRFSRASLIWTSAIMIAASAIPLAFIPVLHGMGAWIYVIVVGIILGIVDALYLPATNALMVAVPPEHRQGRSVAVFQTSAAVGMALFPLLVSLLQTPYSALMWIITAVSVMAGAACYSLATANAPANIKYAVSEEVDA